MKLIASFKDYKPAREQREEYEKEKREYIEDKCQRERVAYESMHSNHNDPRRWRRVADGMRYGDLDHVCVYLNPEDLKSNCYKITRSSDYTFYVINPINDELSYQVIMNYGGRGFMFIQIITKVLKELNPHTKENVLREARTFRFYVDKTQLRYLKDGKVLSELDYDQLFEVYCDAISFIERNGYEYRPIDFEDIFDGYEGEVYILG